MKFRLSKPKLSLGFTLIELLVAISIIAILVAISATSVGIFFKKARNSQRLADLRKIQYALEQYHIDHGFYPIDSAGFGLGVPGIAGPPPFTECTGAGTAYVCPGTPKVYLKTIPRDPNW